MFTRYFILVLTTFFCSFSTLYSQNRNSIKREQKILVIDTITFDSLPILPNSLEVFYQGEKISNSLFEVNESKATLKCKNCPKDSLILKYFAIPIMNKYHWVQGKEVKYSNEILKHTPIYNLADIPTENTANLDYSGSFVRGITMGNRQDAAVQSGFNFNLNGELGNGLEINASMNDANIPIQPEGNSASLQEFDRIYIQLKKDDHFGKIGDIDIANTSDNYFLKFNRKLQGINYASDFELKNKKHLKIGGTAALTRGVFGRNVFDAIENNQGPYKLRGNNGETFIIIIAGTEKVYINGQLMKRGTENDYVINYNLGELIFTPNRLITDDLRIVVEFQYTDRSYFRYSLEGNMEYRTDKFMLFSQIYSERDAKNQPINIDLSKEQYEQLATIGNKTDSAFVSSENLTEWDETRILYIKKDTTVGGNNYSDIYSQAFENVANLYALTFTEVGKNKGNYRIMKTGANGAVYEWVAPINNIPQGSFEPIMPLITPKTHLQWSVGSDMKWSKAHSTHIEVSLTDFDPNTISEIDNDKNGGVGVLFNHSIRTEIDSHKSIRVILNQEYTSSSFAPITRYRNNEFQRDWGVNLPISNQNQQSISNVGLEYHSNNSTSSLDANMFIVEDMYEGMKFDFSHLQNIRKHQLDANVSWLLSNIGDSAIDFLRPRANFNTKLTEKIQSTVGFFNEIKKVTVMDTLSSSSFLWQNYFTSLNFLNNSDKLNFKYIYRTEHSPTGNEFGELFSRSHTFNLNGSNKIGSKHNLEYTLTYRNYKSDTRTDEIKNNYLGNIKYRGKFLKNSVISATRYQVKAGREQKLQLTFIKAPNNYGNYAWKDLNENGTLEINEIFVSPIFTENIYTKYYISLPEFIATNELNFSQNIWLKPKAIWYDKDDIRKWISKWQYTLRLDINKKSTLNSNIDVGEFLSPFVSFQDSSLIFSRSNLFQQLSFQKNVKKIGWDIDWRYSEAKNLLSNGVEGVSNIAYKLSNRSVISNFLTYRGSIEYGSKNQSSEFFKDRNFAYDIMNQDNILSIFFNNSFKTNLIANLSNQWNDSVTYQSLKGELETIISHKHNGLISAKFSMLNIDFDDDKASSQLQLSMLNGFNTGVNYFWNLTIGQKITKFIQLNILYNGRKNAQSDFIVHTGQVEARAIF